MHAYEIKMRMVNMKNKKKRMVSMKRIEKNGKYEKEINSSNYLRSASKKKGQKHSDKPNLKSSFETPRSSFNLTFQR